MGDLKRTPQELAEDKREITADYEPNPYGWGTKLCLEDEQIDAARAGGLRVGQRVKIVGFATVTRVSSSESEDQREGRDSCRTLELQVTDLEASPASTDNPASVLYPAT